MSFDPHDPRITAYVFDELDAEQKEAFEEGLESSAELREEVQQIRDMVKSLGDELQAEPLGALSSQQREQVASAIRQTPPTTTGRTNDEQPAAQGKSQDWVQRNEHGGRQFLGRLLVGSIALLLLIGFGIYGVSNHYQRTAHQLVAQGESQLQSSRSNSAVAANQDSARAQLAAGRAEKMQAWSDYQVLQERERMRFTEDRYDTDAASVSAGGDATQSLTRAAPTKPGAASSPAGVPPTAQPAPDSYAVDSKAFSPNGRAINGASPKAKGRVELSKLSASAQDEQYFAPAPKAGYVAPNDGVNPADQPADGDHDRLREFEEERARGLERTPDEGRGPGQGGDKHDLIVENPFKDASQNPLSTFSIDVDTASYSKIRSYLLNNGAMPRRDAVRIEEMVNYFPYDYAPPRDEKPFAAHMEIAECPWSPGHRLARIAIKGKVVEREQRPLSNLVFLLDISGSMKQPNKLPLLKRAMKLLVDQLGENDQVAIVVYAGAAGLVLDSTSGQDKQTIHEALDRLAGGGSTAGGAGIKLAYQVALDHFIQGGVNRVILCTDGDFNVGVSGTDELVQMVEKNAKSNIFLSVLGFGMGNHNDAMLEQITNKGNGNYAFIDTDAEARKVLVEQMSGTLVTIAKDVKIQIEFNPQKVAAYRLIGYENRILASEDFNDDTKDAGEIGAGHTVTALYELVPAEADDVALPEIDELRYQRPAKPTKAASSGETLVLKLRYKLPDEEQSAKLEFPIQDEGKKIGETSKDFRFAAAVASFGMLLRDSKYKGNATWDAVLEIGSEAGSDDATGYRAEFLQLVSRAKQISGQ